MTNIGTPIDFIHYGTYDFFRAIKNDIINVLQTPEPITITRDPYIVRRSPDRYVPRHVTNISIIIRDTPDNVFMDLVGLDDFLEPLSERIELNIQVFQECPEFDIGIVKLIQEYKLYSDNLLY